MGIFHISQSDIDWMAETEESTLPARCIISRSNTDADQTGGGDRSYTDDDDSIACDVVPLTDSESVGIASGRESSVSQYVITIPRNNEVKSTDQIKLVNVDDNDEITETLAKFEIVQPGTFDPLETAIEIVGKLVQ